MKGCFILDTEGKEVEVTCTIDEAITICKDAIYWLRTKKGIKYPEALKDWEYKLKQLEQIKRDKNAIRSKTI